MATSLDYYINKYGSASNPLETLTPTPDSLLEQLGRSAVVGALGVPGGLLRTASKIISPLSSTSQRFDEYINSIRPTTGDSNVEKYGNTVAEFLGSMLGFGPAFKGAQLGAKGLGLVAGRLFPAMSERAVAAIANAASKTTAFTGSPLLGRMVAAAPENLATGIGLQAAIDPESLSTPGGLAMGLGGAAIGAAFDKPAARRLFKTATKYVDESAPPFIQEIQKHIGSVADTPAATITAKEQLNNLYTEIVDFTDPLKRAEKAITGESGAVNAALKLGNGTAGKTQAFLTEQMFLPKGDGFDYDFIQSVPAMQKILEPFTSVQDRRLLDTYLAAARSTDERIATAGKAVLPFDSAIGHQAVDWIKTNRPDIAQAGQQLIDVAKIVKEYAVRSNLISRTTADIWDAQSPNYVPLFRVMDELIDPSLVTKDTNFGVGKIFKKLEGSDRDINEPVDNIKELVSMTIKAADRNRTANAVYDLFNNADPAVLEQMGISILKGSDKFSNPKFWQSVDDVVAKAKSQGHNLTQQQGAELLAKFGKQFDPDTKVLSVWKDGVVKRIQLNDELAKVYQGMSPADFGLFTKLMSIPARTLRTGITTALDFTGVNLIRDSFEAMLRSQYGFRLGVDSFKGLMEAMKKGQYYKEFMTSGAGFGQVGRYGNLNPSNVFQNITPMTKAQIAKNIFLHPIDALKTLARPFEEAARVGEFMLARKKGADLTEAALAARNVTTDFMQIGGSMKALSQMTAFLNPAIQGLARDAAVATGNPLGVAAKGFAAISIPSITLWFANRNDQEINELRKTAAGSTNWFIRLPNGEIGKIPKPFLAGQVFGTTMERALDSLLENDPNAIEGMAKSIWNQASMNMIPNAAMLPISLYANKNPFTGAPIIPAGMEDAAPDAQVQPYTSKLARRLNTFISGITGETVNISPIHLDYLIRNTTGTLGKDATSIADAVLFDDGVSPPAKTPADLPFFSRFFARQDTTGTEPVQKFYKNLKKVSEVSRTMALYEKRGQYDKLQKYIEDNYEYLAVADIYAESQKQLREIRDTLEQFINAPDDVFDPEMKREYTKYFNKQINDITRGVNTVVDQLIIP